MGVKRVIVLCGLAVLLVSGSKNNNDFRGIQASIEDSDRSSTLRYIKERYKRTLDQHGFNPHLPQYPNLQTAIQDISVPKILERSSTTSDITKQKYKEINDQPSADQSLFNDPELLANIEKVFGPVGPVGPNTLDDKKEQNKRLTNQNASNLLPHTNLQTMISNYFGPETVPSDLDSTKQPETKDQFVDGHLYKSFLDTKIQVTKTPTPLQVSNFGDAENDTVTDSGDDYRFMSKAEFHKISNGTNRSDNNLPPPKTRHQHGHVKSRHHPIRPTYDRTSILDIFGTPPPSPVNYHSGTKYSPDLDQPALPQDTKSEHTNDTDHNRMTSLPVSESSYDKGITIRSNAQKNTFIVHILGPFIIVMFFL